MDLSPSGGAGASLGETVLSIDDGGTRGYIALLVLKALMGEIEILEHKRQQSRPIEGFQRDVRHTPPELKDTNNSTPTSLYTSVRQHMLSLNNRNETVVSREGPLPLPCEYFDTICGSGTGGYETDPPQHRGFRNANSTYSLIAIMLGRLRMPLDACIKDFIHLTLGTFQESRQMLSFSRMHQDSHSLEDKLDKLILSQELRVNETTFSNVPFASPCSSCKM